MTLYTPLLMEAVTGDPAITYHAQDFRNIVAALSPVEGMVLSSDLAVTQRAAGANLSVDVAPGKALIKGDSIANQGTYICHSDTTYNVALIAANATNPRIDIIVARVRDKQADGGSTYGWTIEAIAGVPAASPSAPAVPASAVKLADVRVNANATSVLAANITDRRTLSGVGDVPKWDLFGTPGQSIPNVTTVAYQQGSAGQVIGVDRSGSSITIKTPGRYVVHFGLRIGVNGTPECNRLATLAVSKNGTVTRRIANTVRTGGALPVSTSGTFYLDAGDVVGAYIYQDSGGPLNVDDGALEADWTGVWVGA